MLAGRKMGSDNLIWLVYLWAMWLRKSIPIFCLLTMLFAVSAKGQAAIVPDSTATDSTKQAVNKQRLLVLGTSFSAGYSAMLISLNKAWYQEKERTGFHFFNDNHEWRQVDKAGHFWGTFHE